LAVSRWSCVWLSADGLVFGCQPMVLCLAVSRWCCVWLSADGVVFGCQPMVLCLAVSRWCCVWLSADGLVFGCQPMVLCLAVSRWSCVWLSADGLVFGCQPMVFYETSSSSSSLCGSTTLSAEFWPSQPLPSIFFYPGQESSNLALLTSVYFFNITLPAYLWSPHWPL